MIFKNAISVIFLILLMNYSQTYGQISGVIWDEVSNSPIAGANVYIAKSKIGTISDDEGRFKLALPSFITENDTLVIEYLGYHTIRIKLNNFTNKTKIIMKPTSFQLEQAIDVFAERIDISNYEIPHQITELTYDELKRSATSEIGDLFKKTPSIRLEGNDIQGRHIQIRGSDASEVNVYFDGILMNDLSSDQTMDISIIPIESLTKIEVLKGSNFPLLGQGAFGGVVNLHSKKSANIEFMLKAKKGNFESRQYSGYLNLPITKNLIINYFGQYYLMHPEIEYFPGERYIEKSEGKNLTSNRINHMLSIDYFSPLGQIGNKFFNYKLQFTKPGWMNDKSTNLFNIYMRTNNNFNLCINRIDNRDIIERWTVNTTKSISDYQSRRLNIKVSQRISNDINSLVLIGDYYHYELESILKMRESSLTRPYYSSSLYDNRAGIGGIYTFHDKHKKIPNLNWDLSLALRGDFTANGNRHLSNNLGTRVNWNKNNWHLSPYANYGKNVKFPTLYEEAFVKDFYRITGQDTIVESLKPEFNNSFEIGLNYKIIYNNIHFKSFEFDFTYFSSSTYNKIFQRPLGDFIVQSQTGRNTTKGFEVAIKVNSVYKYANFSIAYNQIDISSKLLYDYKPQNNFNYQVELISPMGFFINSLFFYEGKSYASYLDVNNKLKTKSLNSNYDIDLSIGYKIKLLGLSYNLQLGIYNVLDNSGYDYYYLRKRMLMISLALNYQ